MLVVIELYCSSVADKSIENAKNGIDIESETDTTPLTAGVDRDAVNGLRGKKKGSLRRTPRVTRKSAHAEELKQQSVNTDHDETMATPQIDGKDEKNENGAGSDHAISPRGVMKALEKQVRARLPVSDVY